MIKITKKKEVSIMNNSIVTMVKELNKVEQNGQRVLTTAQLAECYGTDSKIIANNFNRNKEHYEENKHYICLKGAELQEFKTVHQFDEQFKHSAKVYLWTERGALLHAKSLNTDKAWEVYENLMEFYFAVKEKQNAVVSIDYLNSLQSKIEMLSHTVTALQNQLTVVPAPDRYTQNIWKKYQSTPSIDKLAETLNMNEADTFDLVYEYMRNHFGFEPAVAIREYYDKYQVESTSTITAIVDNVVYRTLFALSVNSILSECNSECSCVDEVDNSVDNSNTGSDDTIEPCTQIHFTKNDSYDYVIATLSQILNETSTNHNAILRKIYSKMASKQAWHNSMTRWRCLTKKALIEKNEKYYNRFIKVCNEIVETTYNSEKVGV